MYELIQVAERTYYINCPAKMGIYLDQDKGAYLIDTGNDKEAGKKAWKILEENGWKLKVIINTHSNADHIGGNQLLQQRSGAPVYATGIEGAFTGHPLLEPSFLYGGYPPRQLRNKFLMAKPSDVEDIKDLNLPEGFEILPLPGHFFEMIGVRTPDDVWFLADCLNGETVLEKYHIGFIYDVQSYLDTLDMVEGLCGKTFIPAHADASEDIRPLVEANRKKVLEIRDTILQLCGDGVCFEELLKRLFDHYRIQMDFNQYVLVGSTVRSYLAWMSDQGSVIGEFTENRLLWRQDTKDTCNRGGM